MNDLELQWGEQAKLWKNIVPPLRPSTADLNLYTLIIDNWMKQFCNFDPSVLIMGVTPEIYNLPILNKKNIRAIDKTQEMVNTIWPGDKNSVVIADWMDMPIESNSVDIVINDNGLTLLTYPLAHEILIKKLALVIKSGGIGIFRVMIPPKVQERFEQIISDLLAKKISNTSVLKVRLLMSLQTSAEKGIDLKSVFDKLQSIAPSLEELANQLEWNINELKTIEVYKNNLNRYHFFSLENIKNLFCHSLSGFELVATKFPDYELGERFPILVFKKD